MTQEARQTEILRPAVKELIRVEATKRIPELRPPRLRGRDLRTAAARSCSTCRRTSATASTISTRRDFWVDAGTLKAQARRTRPDPAELERAAAIVAKAERPLLLVGGGIHISEAYEALLALAEGLGIPVAHTMSGKGAIACTHPLSAGLFGRYSRIANDLVAASDALIVVGCKLGEIATRRFQLIPPGKPLIHVDILAEEIGRTTRTDVALVADARLALQDLAAALGDGGKARSASARPIAPRCRRAWPTGARARPTGCKSNENADQCRPPDGRTERPDAGRRDPGRGRRLRRPLGRAAASTPSGPGGISSPTAASPRSATGCPAAMGAQLAAPSAPRGRAHRRRRLQHDARRTGDRAPRRRRRSCCACSTTRPPAT